MSEIPKDASLISSKNEHPFNVEDTTFRTEVWQIDQGVTLQTIAIRALSLGWSIWLLAQDQHQVVVFRKTPMTLSQYFTKLKTVKAIQLTLEFLQSDLEIKGVDKFQVYAYADKIGHVGDWIVREAGFNRIMTDKAFKRQYHSAQEHLKCNF